ncbi:MAG: 2-amino-4-hydroxy-6-hydroxymethyldihydropteridine diphosphokinase [Candidatus Cybelea sp.]
MSEHRAYIGLGTNLGDRVANLERAMEAVATFGTLLAKSSLYRTAPWGNLAQPWFLNAVVLLKTELAPRELLDRLRGAEQRLGRTARERWGPREIDLDLLLYDDLEIDEPDLRVPHPQLRERAFVLVPLAEIDDRFESLRDALDASELAGVVRVERESVIPMPEGELGFAGERVRELARFLAESDVTRLRIARGDDYIELAARPRRAPATARSSGRASADSAARVDTIKADLVGIFHAGRPAPVEGEVFEADRELGYIEALGIRTSVHSMGAGRLVSVATADGSPVEYGQPLFVVARTR